MPSFHGDNLSNCHTLPDSTNGSVTDSKILCPFMSVCMRFLSVPHAASFGHVQNFERTPPYKYVGWMNVTNALVCGLSGSRAVCPVLMRLASCRYPVCIR